MTITRTPIGFGPRGCPDARLWMHDHWRVGSILHQCWGIHVEGGLNVEWTPPDKKQQIMQQEIRAAELYWVGSEMCDLVAEATQTVPMDISLTSELIPTPRGMAFMASSQRGIDASPEADPDAYVALDVIHWYPSIRVDSNNLHNFELTIDFYTHTAHSAAQFIYVGGSQWAVGSEIVDTTPTAGSVSSELREQSFLEDRRLLISLIGLIASPGVTDVSEYSPNRAERRRSQRSGIDLNAVRIINLRGSGAESEHHELPDGSRYHNRWMVSGHWRSQPCGPGRSLRKPVWIAPHIKGPEGAPLLNGDKVRVLA